MYIVTGRRGTTNELSVSDTVTVSFSGKFRLNTEASWLAGGRCGHERISEKGTTGKRIEVKQRF